MPVTAPSRASLEKGKGACGRLHKPASCSSHLRREDFQAGVAAGARSAGRRFVLEKAFGAGADHPSLAGLKFAVGRVR